MSLKRKSTLQQITQLHNKILHEGAQKERNSFMAKIDAAYSKAKKSGNKEAEKALYGIYSFGMHRVDRYRKAKGGL